MNETISSRSPEAIKEKLEAAELALADSIKKSADAAQFLSTAEDTDQRTEAIDNYVSIAEAVKRHQREVTELARRYADAVARASGLNEFVAIVKNQGVTDALLSALSKSDILRSVSKANYQVTLKAVLNANGQIAGLELVNPSRFRTELGEE